MEYWFSEMHTDNVKESIRVEKQLFSGTSDFQRIDVFDSQEFGRFITLDGSVIFSEKDEFTYDEMIVHVPMAVHPCVKKVLVIGGGDGGVARELSYYEEIEEMDVLNQHGLDARVLTAVEMNKFAEYFTRDTADRYLNEGKVIGATITAACDIKQDRLDWVRDEVNPDIKLYTDYKEMIDSGEIKDAKTQAAVLKLKLLHDMGEI